MHQIGTSKCGLLHQIGTSHADLSLRRPPLRASFVWQTLPRKRKDMESSHARLATLYANHGLRHANGMTYTPSSRLMPYCVPLMTIFRSGSLKGTCSSFLLYSLISLSIYSKSAAPLSISLEPNLNSNKAYRPSFRCNTPSASNPYLS